MYMFFTVLLTIIVLNVDNSFTEIVDVDTLWLHQGHTEADIELLCWFRITVLCDIYPEASVAHCPIWA